jgi:cystathionine beta-lyase/cystathionine gamma-synthase
MAYDSPSASTMQIDTQLVHAGALRPSPHGAVVTPVFQSAMYEYDQESSYHDLKYIRLNNTPNHQVLARRIASLEHAQSAVVTASGMAAISTTLLTVLKPGDHLLAQSCLYGGTHSLLTDDLSALGIAVDFIDPQAPETWHAKRTPRTKAIYVESLSNPLVSVADHPSVVAFAKQHGLVSIIDNTFASPVNFRAVAFGYDVSLHSCTKYMNGHSDLVAGAVLGSSAWVDAITHRLNHFGGTLDPHACFLLERGMKTLALRVRQQNHNALALARMLATHPRIDKVHYPGLESHADHALATRCFQGFGGVLSFEMKGDVAEADEMMRKVRLAVRAPSLGGVETLISRPAAASHLGVPRDERLKIGITDNLIRVAVGIEAAEDLVRDFAQALH